MSGWITRSSNAITLINEIDWSDTDDDMVMLRELSFVVDGEREAVKLEIGESQ